MDDEDGGILNIQLSDDEVDVAKKKADRTGQTEEEFQAVKREYRVRVENGDVRHTLIAAQMSSHEADRFKIYKHIQLPLQPGINKMRTQELIHAVEELYFFREYQQGLDLIQRAFADGGAEVLDNDSRQLLEAYADKCRQKLVTSG
jgi:hypothetical protein